MNLKDKAIMTVNTIAIVACVLMGIIGYLRAKNIYAEALEAKVTTDAQAMAEILNSRFSGDWHSINGELFKGEHRLTSVDDFAAELSKICNAEITIFNGDTPVDTTFKDLSGKRAFNTKASPFIVETVLKQGKSTAQKRKRQSSRHGLCRCECGSNGSGRRNIFFDDVDFYCNRNGRLFLPVKKSYR